MESVCVACRHRLNHSFFRDDQKTTARSRDRRMVLKNWLLSLLSRRKMTNLVDQVVASYGREDKVKIKNPDKIETLLQTIVSAGPKQLQVITDFDLTLTRYHLNGKRCESSYGIIANSPLCPAKLKTDAWELFEKYYPIEIDVKLSKEEKHPHMVEWYEKSHESFLKSEPRLKRSLITEMVKDCQCFLRENAVEMLNTLSKAEIPTLILSAGMGDLVEEVLRHNSSMHSNLKVISNFMKFDENGVICGFTDPIVHVFNKNGAALHGDNCNYFEDLKSRSNVVLIGDSLGDIDMDAGVKNANAVLKIGFLNSHIDEHLPTYMDVYDVVLVDDQSMDFVNLIMELIVKPK